MKTADPVEVLARENRALHNSVATLTAELLLVRESKRRCVDDLFAKVRATRQILIAHRDQLSGAERIALAEVGIEL